MDSWDSRVKESPMISTRRPSPGEPVLGSPGHTGAGHASQGGLSGQDLSTLSEGYEALGVGIGTVGAGVLGNGVLGNAVAGSGLELASGAAVRSVAASFGSVAEAEPQGGWERYRLTVAMVTRAIIAALSHHPGPLRRPADPFSGPTCTSREWNVRRAEPDMGENLVN